MLKRISAVILSIMFLLLLFNLVFPLVPSSAKCTLYDGVFIDEYEDYGDPETLICACNYYYCWRPES